MRLGTVDDPVPLAENFARTLLVGRYPSDDEFKLIADAFHPDVVIEERAERLMTAVPVRHRPLSNTTASVVSFNPSSGNGSSQAFTAVYSSPAGGEDILATQVMVNSSAAWANSCFFGYDESSHRFLLLNHAGTAWLAAGAPPGSGSVANNQSTILGAGSSATVLGDQLTVVYNVRFKPVFAGSKTIWTNAYSKSSKLASPLQANAGGAKLSWTVK